MSLIMKTTSCLLLLILAITCTVTGRDRQYRKFLDQHYKYGMRTRDCNKKMNVTNELYNANKCKPLNSIITKPNWREIKAVCDGAGRSFHMAGIRNLRESLHRFEVVTCEYTGESGKAPCKYEGTKEWRYIVIACNEKKLPVHYQFDHN
ncbi:hypothetical protein GJAV_G00256260 [Gymnothorax javanicus]|nr:hypothetical protein GJAV_G00256260 [Gymnothorax javanicus]